MLSIFPRTVGFRAGGAVCFVCCNDRCGSDRRACAHHGTYRDRGALFWPFCGSLRAFALAAAAMVLWNPATLLFDPSFVILVLATFGLITLSPAVEEKLPKFLSRLPQIRSIAASTIAVQIFVLPALLYMTGVFSLFALPANILVASCSSICNGLWVFARASWIYSSCSALPAMVVADLLLRFMMFVATTVQSLPFSSAVLAAFPLWVAVVVYIPLTALAFRLYNRGEP